MGIKVRPSSRTGCSEGESRKDERLVMSDCEDGEGSSALMGCRVNPGSLSNVLTSPTLYCGPNGYDPYGCRRGGMVISGGMLHGEPRH